MALPTNADVASKVVASGQKSISTTFTIYPPRGLSIFDLLAYQGKPISYRGADVGRADKVEVKTDGSVVITVKKIDEALSGKKLGLDLVLRDQGQSISAGQVE